MTGDVCLACEYDLEVIFGDDPRFEWAGVMAMFTDEPDGPCDNGFRGPLL